MTTEYPTLSNSPIEITVSYISSGTTKTVPKYQWFPYPVATVLVPEASVMLNLYGEDPILVST